MKSFFRGKFLLFCIAGSWTLTKEVSDKLEEKNTMMLRALFRRSWEERKTSKGFYRKLQITAGSTTEEKAAIHWASMEEERRVVN